MRGVNAPGLDHRRNATIFAAFAVLLMVSSAVIPLFNHGESWADFTDDDYYVVYDPGSIEGLYTGFNDVPNDKSDANCVTTIKDSSNSTSYVYKQVKVKYDGVPVSEYNPQFWAGSIDSHATPILDDVSYSKKVVNWYPIKDYVAGFNNDGESATLVFTGWEVSGKEIVVDPGTDLSKYFDQSGSNTLVLEATWDYLWDVRFVDGDNDDDHGNGWPGHVERDDGSKERPTSISTALNGGRYAVGQGEFEGLKTNCSYAKHRSFLILYFNDSGENRDIGVSTIDKSLTIRSYDTSNPATLSLGGTWDINKEIIIDNAVLKGSSYSDHGALNTGIYLNGNATIFGTGLSGSGVQISGGSRSEDQSYSNIVIFSGDYLNIFGGSSGQNEYWGWSNDKYRYYTVSQTNIRILGGTISDSVYGGDYGGVSDYLDDSPTTKVTKTNILIVGGKVWDGTTTEIEGDVQYQTVVGGSRFGDAGTTNITISGKAEVFAVQGGGRSGVETRTDETNVHVNGNAQVIYLVCGSVTDGNNSNSTAPVGSSNVEIGGSSSIGSESNDAGVYAGGWDTYTASIHPSTEKTKLVIKDSCTIHGNVFGGGFRGTVGIVGSNVDYVVDIDILGGQINGSLYGGGSGGPDPLKHAGDSYGKAYVQGNVSILVQNAKISGSVYGGGLGVPESGDSELAKVTGDVELDIISSSIEGSVYGGGAYGSVGSSEDSSEINIMLSGCSSVKSIFGGGQGYENDLKLGGVTAGNLTISVSGGSTVDEYIYGGGRLGSTSADSVLITVAGSNVNGAVFGGGMGETGEPSVAKSTFKSISIIIDGGSQIGDLKDQYALFGGGAAAYTDVDEVSVVLGESTINGDVHGGGYGLVPGSTEPESTMPIMSHDRTGTIIMNGATVNGSVYGGSRSGHDMPLEGSDSVSDFGQSNVYLLSGVVMQGVFGGGFMGETYMNATILVGTSAFDATGTLPYVRPGDNGPDLRLNNIYGGGNLNSPGNDPFGDGSELLMGDVSITISGGPSTHGGISFSGYRMPGPGDASDVPKISIYGDIFGQGNYSAIGGTSVIYIHDYDQDNQYYIQSIQRATELHISDSSIIIEGSADGTSTGMSVMVSINSITGSVNLEGGVVLGLMAQTSGIQSYNSFVEGSPASDRVYTGGDAEKGNEIILYEGRLLYVLGPNDTGLDGKDKVGKITGYTLLSRPDGDTYYGAFATGSHTSGDQNEVYGFVVNNEGSMEVAAFIADSNEITKTWYISGHISVGMVMTFGDETDEGGVQLWTDSDTVTLPKLSEGSLLAYSASYVDPTAQDGLYFLTKSDYNGFIGGEFNAADDVGYRDFFSMTLKATNGSNNPVSVRTHTYNSDATGSQLERLERYYFDGVNYEATSTNFSIKIDAEFLSSTYYGDVGDNILGTSGNVGSVIIHLVEVTQYTVNGKVQYMPVNMIDLNVSLNVMPKSQTPQNITITVMTSRSTSGYVGTGYVIFPSKGSRQTYTMSDYSNSIGGEIVMYADSTYLSYQGWVGSQYMSEGHGLKGSQLTDTSIVFGEGGVKDSVMRVQYEGSGSCGKVEFTMGTTDGTTYQVTVNFVASQPVELGLAYTDLDGNTWILSVQHVENDGGYYILSWVPESTSGVESTIELPYGSVLSSHEIQYSDTYGSKPMSGTVEEAMGWLLTKIPEYQFKDGSGEKFVYADNLDGWYVGNTLKYSMTSPLKESLTLTAKFGVKVTFHGDNVSLTHTWVMIPPGTSLHDNGIGAPGETQYNIVPWDGNGTRGGYHLATGLDGNMYWVKSQDSPEDAFDFGQDLYSDIDLYIPWIPNQYAMTVTVNGIEDQTQLTTLIGMTGDGESLSFKVDGNNIEVTVSYDMEVSLTLNGEEYRVMSAVYGDLIGNTVVISGVPGTHISFTVPNAGDNNASGVTLDLTLSNGLTFNIEYMGETELSNGIPEEHNVILTVDEERLTFEGTDSYVQGILVEAGNVTIKVVVPDGYWYAIWIDNKLKDDWSDSIGGRTRTDSFTVNVTGDTVLAFAVYRGVGLTVDERLSENPSVSIGAVDVTGKSTRYYNGENLFKGYEVTVTVGENWALPPTQVGTNSGQVSGGTGVYAVLGTEDVVITAEITAVTVHISIGFRDGTDAIGKTELSVLTGYVLTYTVNKVTGSLVLTDNVGDDGAVSVSVRLPAADVGGTVVVSASMPGFSQGSSTMSPGSGTEVDVDVFLTLLSYEVRYYTLDGRMQIWTSVWNVLMGPEESRPGIESNNGVTVVTEDNHQVWMSKGIGSYSIVEMIAPGMFATSTVLDLYALPPLDGETGNVWEVTVVATPSQFAQGVYVNLGNSSFTTSVSVGASTVDVVYDGVEKILVLNGTGTGSFTVQYENVRITVLVLADLEGGSEAV